jgi:uncharacterized protein YggE
MEIMETSIKITLIIVAAILLVGVVGGFLYWKSANPETTINVNGDATIKASPDVISVYFNVQTNGTTAEEAKNLNAEVVDKVITNLIKLGLERKDITTENFNVYPDYKYDYTTGEQTLLGYKATYSLIVKLKLGNLDKVGSVIDAGVDGGALINNINFELSPDLENQYKAAALKAASEDARTKADSVASGLGKTVTGIQSVSESNFNYYPWRLYDNVAMASGGAEAKQAATNIQPGDKDVTAQVNVVFKIK